MEYKIDCLFRDQTLLLSTANRYSVVFRIPTDCYLFPGLVVDRDHYAKFLFEKSSRIRFYTNGEKVTDGFFSGVAG